MNGVNCFSIDGMNFSAAERPPAYNPPLVCLWWPPFHFIHQMIAFSTLHLIGFHFISLTALLRAAWGAACLSSLLLRSISFIHEQINLFIHSTNCCRRRQTALLLIGFVFMNQSISLLLVLFSWRSHWLAHQPITHQSKREERDCFHHSNSGCLHQKLKFLYCGLFGLFSARNETIPPIDFIHIHQLSSFIHSLGQPTAIKSINFTFLPIRKRRKEN